MQNNLGCLVPYICMDHETLDATRLAIMQAWKTPWQPSDDTRKMVGKGLVVHADRLQIRGDWALGVWISLLGSEEMLLEMSSDKLTCVAL